MPGGRRSDDGEDRKPAEVDAACRVSGNANMGAEKPVWVFFSQSFSACPSRASLLSAFFSVFHLRRRRRSVSAVVSSRRFAFTTIAALFRLSSALSLIFEI